MKKKWFCLIPVFMLLFIFFPKKVEAAQVRHNFTPEISVDGDLIVTTYDKYRTSKIIYRTIGITLSRNIKGTDTRYHDGSGNSHYVEFRFDEIATSESEEIFDYNGVKWQKTTYTYDYSTIISRIRASYPDWADEIENARTSGEYYSMYFDSVMVIIDLGEGGAENPRGDYIGGGYDKMGKVYMKSDAPFDANTRPWNPELVNFGWANPSGIYDHYDRLIVFNGFREPIEEPESPPAGTYTIGSIDPTKPTPTGMAGGPEFGTKNWSDVYQVGLSIPSSEPINNAILFDDWYGTVSVSEKYVSKIYSVEFALTIHHSMTADVIQVDGSGNPIIDSVTGMPVKKPETITYDTEELYTTNVVRHAKYHYISNASLRQADSAVVSNEVYPNGEINYQCDIPDLQYELVIDGKINPSNPRGTGSEAWHVKWANGVTTRLSAEGNSQEGARNAAKSIAESLIHQPEVKNDGLKLDGKMYMDYTKVYIATADKPDPAGATVKNANGSTYYIAEVHQTEKPDSGIMTVVIPAETANGPYDTAMKMVYREVYPASQTKSALNLLKKDAILDGYKQNEPVYVHTPVISPVTIIDNTTGGRLPASIPTQLVESARCPDVDYQLRLDKEYTCQFDAAMHKDLQGYGWSGDPSKYDKYISARLVRYPFSVEQNGVFYEVGADGYTQWIECERSNPGTNELFEFEFYIPSWSQEGVYGVNSALGASYADASPRMIEYRVEAINAITDEQLGSEEDNANLNPDNYVATYRIPVQISGTIYGLEVVGINDELTFGGRKEVTEGLYRFAHEGEEHKSGTNNRIGEPYVRFTKDDVLTNHWLERDTLPLTSGKSKYYPGMGYLMPGHIFSFTLETISNLNNLGDYIVIEPVYRFIGMDGTVDENVDIYYKDNNDQFVKIGSNESRILTGTARIGSNWYDDTYKERNLDFTASWDAEQQSIDDLPYTKQLFLNSEVPCYNYGIVKITDKLKLLVGSYSRLERYLDTPVNAISPWPLTVEQDKALEGSMQKWYGKYGLPNKVYVVDSGTDLMEYIRDKGSIDDTDPVFKKDGYLAVNFDIIAYKQGKPYLKYGNGSDGMWAKETGIPHTGGPDDPTTTVKPIDGGDPVEFPYEYGDIGVITITDEYYDLFNAGILLIN